MSKIETGSLNERAAVGALFSAECELKRKALWEAGRALERAGATDERQKQSLRELDRARDWIAEAERAERNRQRLDKQLRKGEKGTPA